LPVPLSDSGDPAIHLLPVDPVNNGPYGALSTMYVYGCNSDYEFEINLLGAHTGAPLQVE